MGTISSLYVSVFRPLSDRKERKGVQTSLTEDSAEISSTLSCQHTTAITSSLTVQVYFSVSLAGPGRTIYCRWAMNLCSARDGTRTRCLPEGHKIQPRSIYSLRKVRRNHGPYPDMHLRRQCRYVSDAPDSKQWTDAGPIKALGLYRRSV